MSLQFWLPLVKDFKNYGLNQSFVLPSSMEGINLASNGKIGTNCFDSSGTALNKFSNGSIDFSLGDAASLAMWIYIPSTYVYNQYNYLFQFNTSGNTAYARTVLGLALEYPMTINDETVVGLRVLIGGNNAYIKNPIVPDAWNHIVATWGDNKVSLYLNGTYLSKANLSKGSAVNAAAFSLATNKGATNGIGAKFNDVRVYDHCLSPKEVEEIAKGLIAHYKLDKVETKNYLIPPYDRSEKYNTTGVVSSTSANHYTNIIIPTERIDPLPGSGIYTYSAYIYNTSNANICVSCILCNSEGDNLGVWAYGNYILPGEEGLSIVTVDGTALADVVSARGRLYYSKSLRDMTSEFSYQYFKFEKNPVYTYWTPGGDEPNVTVYDCSGYRNNGTGYGNLAVVAGSPRYNTAVEFSDQGYYQGLPSLNNSTNLVNKYTITFWLNKTEENTSTQNEYVLSAGPIQVRASSNGYLNLLRTDFKTTNDGETVTSGSNVPSSLGKLLVGEWHHYAIVFDDGKILYYKDGEYVYTRTGLGQYLYGEYNTTKAIGQHLLAKLSDLRIYMTALTAAAVKELYNTSMQVDASGNVYARELVQL